MNVRSALKSALGKNVHLYLQHREVVISGALIEVDERNDAVTLEASSVPWRFTVSLSEIQAVSIESGQDQ